MSSDENTSNACIAITAENSQIIEFSANDEECCKEITKDFVTIYGSAGTHDHGSSHVKLKNFVDYKWEVKQYPARLIAVHMDGNYVAYAINVGLKGGMVRVVEVQSGQRTLIKGMKGEVLDLQFAHYTSERMLASIDKQSLFIHRIEYNGHGHFSSVRILMIEDPLENYTPGYDKVSWCPYLAKQSHDDDESDYEDPYDESDKTLDYNFLIAWARANTFQIFDIDVILNYRRKKLTERLKEVKKTPSELLHGYITHTDPKSIITCMTLSPNGDTLGVGSLDGYVRFYQVYMYDKTPRCLKQWYPHNGKPISSLFFLDDKNCCRKDVYWQYALTGADNNTEFKLWWSSDWAFLQQINICTKLDKNQQKSATDATDNSHFLAEIDATASYLVLTNYVVRACYVFQIETLSHTQALILPYDMNSTYSMGKQLQSMYIKRVCEFPMHSGILSFSLIEPLRTQCQQCAVDDNDDVDEFEDDQNNTTKQCISLNMFIVQPKSMQECRIMYKPKRIESDESIVMANNNETLIEDGIETFETSLNASANSPLIDLADVSISSASNNNNQDNESSATTTTPPTVRSLSTTSKTEPSESISPYYSASSRNSTLLEEKKTATTNVTATAATSTATTAAAETAKSNERDIDIYVMQTLKLLASVTTQPLNTPKPDRISWPDHKMLEDEEHKKMQLRKSLENEKPFVAIDNHPERHIAEHVPSGSSSPSREVQEILSSQQSFKNDHENGNDLLKALKIDLNDTTDAILNSNTNTTANLKATEWPEAPSVPKQSAELQNAANLIAQAVQPNNNVLPTFSNQLSSSSSQKNTDIEELSNKMTQMMDLIKKQTAQINGLKKEVQELKNVKTGDAKNLTEFSFKIEMQLSKLMEQYLKRYENEHNKKLSAFLTGRDVQNRDLRDNILQVLNQYILTQFGDVASKVIIFEIQRQLVPLINGKIDHLQQQIQVDIAQKFNAFDIMLKETISKACKSKSIIDAFGKSVLGGVQGSLQTAFVESMSSTLIPAYEKASQNMFQQLHDAFAQGIKEFMDQFEVYLQQLKPMNDNADLIVQNMSNVRQSLDEIVVKQHQMIAEAIIEYRKDIKTMEIMLTRQVSETMKHELKKCFDQQTITLRSQANTPAPQLYDMRDTIRMLLQQGQINRAFHQALLADDLNLVEFTLKAADHNSVFTPQCCLEQKVLLSLINQISADMTNHNEIKQNYLTEALLAINPADPITREHAPKVLHELFRNCQKFLISFPKSPQCSNVRMLMKGVQAYIEQF